MGLRAATTTTTRATPRSSPAPSDFARRRSCTRSTGPRTSTTPASRSSSSAAAPPRSRWCRRWPTASAEHVTMLQRSPSYILSLPGPRPARATAARGCRRGSRYPIVRWKAILLAVATLPARASAGPTLREEADPQGDRASSCRPSVDVDVHFKPAYNPWDQRLCFVPDGDLFRALRTGTASIVTDHIETFTETGIRLRVGRGARGRHHRHRDRPATSSRWAASSSSVDGAPVDVAEHHDLQGADAQRRAQLRLHDRLHQRLLDAEGRPGRRLRLPAARPHGRARRTDGRGAARTRRSARSG